LTDGMGAIQTGTVLLRFALRVANRPSLAIQRRILRP